MARRVIIVAISPVQALDVTGPAEVLSVAAQVQGGAEPAYAVEVVGPAGAPIATGSGYALAPAGALEDVRGPLDTLVVAGGSGARHAPDEVVARVAGRADRARPAAAGCNGAH